MFRIGNAVSKRLRHDHAMLTARINSEVLADMHRRYQTSFLLDDEVSASQSGCMHHRPRHNMPPASYRVDSDSPRSSWRCGMGSGRYSHTQREQEVPPLLPWGVVLAFCGIAASLTLLLYIALVGMDLG